MGVSVGMSVNMLMRMLVGDRGRRWSFVGARGDVRGSPIGMLVDAHVHVSGLFHGNVHVHIYGRPSECRWTPIGMSVGMPEGVRGHPRPRR